MQFTDRNDVGAGAECGQRRQHGDVAVRLDGEIDLRVETGQGVRENRIVTDQRRRRIAIERRADGSGHIGQTDILGIQLAVLVVEMIHVRS